MSTPVHPQPLDAARRARVVDDLTRAWEAWDRRPGAIDTTGALEDLCVVLAPQLGTTVIGLRTAVTDQRRTGADVRESVAAAVDGLCR